MRYIRPGALLRAIRRGGDSPAFGSRADVAKAIGSGAIAAAARRQFQKTQTAAVQAHVRAQGQRDQARRDAR